MLSWSAQQTGRTIDLAPIGRDGAGDTGLPGGAELIRLGLSARRPDHGAFAAVREVLGEAAAVEAAAVAANFQIMNRTVDATGLPYPKPQQERMAHVIDLLDLGRFPHAGV